MKPFISITVLLFFSLLYDYGFADYKYISVCAKNSDGVPYYVHSNDYHIRAQGAWKGKGRERMYSANGSPRRPSNKKRLIAPRLPGGALILKRENGKYEMVGVSNKRTFDNRELVTFIFNDYSNAYHDNSGCVDVLIASSPSVNAIPDLCIAGITAKKNSNGGLIFIAQIVNNGGTLPHYNVNAILTLESPSGSARLSMISERGYRKDDKIITFVARSASNVMPTKVGCTVDPQNKIRDDDRRNNKLFVSGKEIQFIK